MKRKCSTCPPGPTELGDLCSLCSVWEPKKRSAQHRSELRAFWNHSEIAKKSVVDKVFSGPDVISVNFFASIQERLVSTGIHTSVFVVLFGLTVLLPVFSVENSDLKELLL